MMKMSREIFIITLIGDKRRDMVKQLQTTANDITDKQRPQRQY